MRTIYNSLATYIEKKFRIDAHYFLSGGIWLTLGQFITIAFGVLTTALFAHFLNENDYGIYRYLVGLAAIFSTFSLTGLGQSILQAAAKKYYQFYNDSLKKNLIYNSGVIAIGVIAAVYYFLNNNNVLAIGCLIIALVQPFINVYQFIPSYLIGSRRFKESTIFNLIRTLIISVASITVLLITRNIIILLITYLTTNAIINLVGHYILKPEVSNTDQEVLNKYMKYAKHSSFRNIISTISQKIDIVVVFTQLSAVELATYTIATLVPEQIKGSFKNLATLLLPKYAAHTDMKQLKKSIPKRSLQLLSVLILITIAYIFIAPYIYSLLFPKYIEAIFYSQISALAFPTFILFIPYSILQSQLEEKILHEITVYSSIFQIVAIFVGILTYGLMGAIIAKILYRIFLMLISYLYVFKLK